MPPGAIITTGSAVYPERAMTFFPVFYSFVVSSHMGSLFGLVSVSMIITLVEGGTFLDQSSGVACY